MMFDPGSALVVDVDDDPSGMLRVYIDHRSYGRYFLIENEEDKARAVEAWDRSFGGHLFVKRPPLDAIFEEPSAPPPPAAPTEDA